MKIIELKAENFKKLKAVEIRPKDNTVVISGKNGQGKTSILDAICAGIGGKDAIKLMTKPIREGEEEASITINLGELEVTRNWTGNDKSYLKVSSSQGVLASPQAVLDKLIGKLSFDPLEFSRMDSKRQKDELLKIVDIGIDLEAKRDEYKKLYDERTLLNRDYKIAKAELESIPVPEKDLPDTEVNVTDLLTEFSKAVDHNRLINEGSKEIENNARKISELQREIDNLSQINKDIEVKLATSELIDTDKLQLSISEAEKTNQKVRDAKKYTELLEKVKVKEDRYSDKDKEMKSITETVDTAIKEAKMPIEGLGVEEDSISFSGIPFSQLSSAEQLKVSLSIAMASNPELRVIRILDGSLLDEDSMETIKQMSIDKDYQVWIEVVDSSGELGVYIEDGEIRKLN